MGEIKKMKVSELYPHPKNSEIYGQDEDVSDLVEKIRRSGQVHTLVVNSNGVILAGHRRCKACKELGIDEVDVEIRNFESAEQEIEYIIDNNATREKTREQKGREAMALKEVIAIIAKQRKVSKLKQNQTFEVSDSAQRNTETEMPKLAQREEDKKGKTRDIIAPKVGLRSGQEVDRVIKAIDKIDELKSEGKTEDAELIRGVLNNRSASAAEILAKNIDIVHIPKEDRDDIKSGKKSPNSYISNKVNLKENEVDNKEETELDSIREQYCKYLAVFQKNVSWLLMKNFYQEDEDVTGKIHSDLQNCLEKFKSINGLMENMQIDDLDDNSIIIKR